MRRRDFIQPTGIGGRFLFFQFSARAVLLAILVEGEYRNAYVGHATLEPHTSVAKWRAWADPRWCPWARYWPMRCSTRWERGSATCP